MKTALVLAVLFALSPMAPAWAQEHGRHNGDGGGFINNGPGNKDDNSDKNNKPENSKPKTSRNPSGGSHNPNFSTPKNNFRPNKNQGSPVGNNTNPVHHFGNKNVENNGTGNTNPHHFGNKKPENNDNAGGLKNKGFDHKPNNSPNGNAWGHTKQIPGQLKKMGVTRMPRPIQDRKKILHTDSRHSVITRPSQGPDGHTLHATLLEPHGNNVHVLQNHMTSIVNNTTFTAQVSLYNNRETQANHYYWHTWNGTNYCHYYDNWGYHWYGWYWGGHCFWSRWYGGNWWWYDPVAFRWCYWYDGYWWWQDPYHVNVVYIYDNDQYVPANSEDTVEATNPSTTVSYSSKDGTRMVKIVDGDAFLYDTAEGESDNKPVYLASNVKEVKFSGAREGKPLQVLLVFDDGSFEMFDSDGNAYNSGGDDYTNN